jgi:DNA-binding transcriptional regulator YdaS (Cro superfamily)
MTADEFSTILDAAGFNTVQAAKALGVVNATVFRWLNGDTPISEARAAIIRERIKSE